jgi:hypothetical protein
MNDEDTTGADDRPSKEELIGASSSQLERQGSSGQSDDGAPHYEEDGGGLYQVFLGTVSIALLVLGIIALAAWGWVALNAPEKTPSPAVEPADFIYTELKQEIFVATSSTVADALAANQPKRPSVGAFSQIYFTEPTAAGKKLLPSPELLNRLDDEPGTIGRYLEDEFMYGHHITAEQAVPYLIFAVADYEATYGTLLQTESRLAAGLTTLGFPETGAFHDDIIDNQDVRVASSSATGGSGLYYSFPRPEWLVITTTEDTLRSIFTRLEADSQPTTR